MAERRLFALDQNFPLPIVKALADYLREAELVALKDVDPRLSELDDWEVLLALHHHERAWDGLITTDIGMTRLPRELAVLLQTKLSLVIAQGAGHDPIRATGLVLTHLPAICRHTEPETAQIWRLSAAEKRPEGPWPLLAKLGRSAGELYDQYKLSAAELRLNPLSH